MKQNKSSILIVSAVIIGVAIILGGVVSAKSEDSKGKYVQDEIIVKFKGDTEPFRVIKVSEGKVGEKMKEYLKRVDVEYTEPNYIAHALMVPNDPYYKHQWHLDNSVYGGIQTEEAWDISTGLGVTVAVVDTGIRKGTDLANTCFVAGYDYVNNDIDPIDDNGHGTHVAGTVAQSTNDFIGTAGIAFNSCLMPVKVLDKTGAGTYSNVALGIRYAADNGAKVINLSLGGSADSITIEDAVAYAYNKGVTVIVSAGNDGSATPSYPAAYDDYVIAVGATRYDETLAYYSNYGPSLDLVAPGGDINVDQDNDGYGDGILQQTFTMKNKRITWGYYFFQGTSMAAPHVAGTAALLIAHGNATTPDDVRAALQETAEDLGTTGRDDTYGYGLVDAYAALNWTAAPVIACSSDTQCDDLNSCTADTCVNPETTTAYCLNTAVVDGTVCDDGQFCTANDVCIAGVCGGLAKDCSDGVSCTVDSCDEATDACVYTSDNALCDDGLYCNGAETCDATLDCLLGTPVNCDDGNECTTDSCDGTLDKCVNNWPVCSISDGCCGPECTSTNDPDCIEAVKCWSASNTYLYQTVDQAKKFCKCAQGTYGYNSYKYNRATKTVWKYDDLADNEDWTVTSSSSKGLIYNVTCTDGQVYPTNVDYIYSK